MYFSRGEKLCKAADLLINLLAGTEKPSTEVYRLVKAHGISNRTLERAKVMVKAKSWQVYLASGKKWVMSVPEDNEGAHMQLLLLFVFLPNFCRCFFAWLLY